MMRFFLDGSLAIEILLSSWLDKPMRLKPVQRVAELGVQNSRLLFQINSDYAGGLFGDISLADFRMYVNDEKGPLSAAEWGVVVNGISMPRKSSLVYVIWTQLPQAVLEHAGVGKHASVEN
jgi:hypothetical protein